MTRTDPRPRLRTTLDQTRRLVAAVTDRERPTPCSEFDVQTLIAHVIAVLRKITAAGRGQDVTTVADPADDIGVDLLTPFDRARAELEQVWSGDADLSATCELPWGAMTGEALLTAYAYEFVVHNWDLASATGRVDDLDPTLAEAALAWYAENVPAGSRGPQSRFGPVVAVGDDADDYTRLAAFVGRRIDG